MNILNKAQDKVVNHHLPEKIWPQSAMYYINRDYEPHRKGDHNGAMKLCSERLRLYCARIWLWRHDDMTNWRPSVRVLISITSGTFMKVMTAHLATIHQWGKLCHCCQSGDGKAAEQSISKVIQKSTRLRLRFDYIGADLYRSIKSS